MKVDVVDAGPDEAEEFLRTMRAGFESLRGRLDPPSGAHDETLAQHLAALAEGGACLARLGPDVVGCARYRLRPDHLYGERVGVLPAFRNRGVGAALMSALEDAARAHGRPQVQVQVRERLIDNVRFYERLGYRRVSAERHPRGPDIVLRMAKDVAAPAS